jgi:hypothetical protein
VKILAVATYKTNPEEEHTSEILDLAAQRATFLAVREYEAKKLREKSE